MLKETQEKLYETIELLCDDVQECIKLSQKNGSHSVGVTQLPDLLNSIANLVNSSRI